MIDQEYNFIIERILLMDKDGIDKKNSIRLMSRLKNSRKKKKLRFSNILFFLIFELIFTACTFPFLLLYGPFENAKRTFVGSAMGTMNTQYLATLFLSEEKINSIIGKSASNTGNETTNISSVKIPKIKDDSIELYEDRKSVV